MPLIVVIETIRAVIRPITLSIRLMANMVAGHLLLRLAGGGIRRVVVLIPLFVGQTALVVLELAVAAIQSYVFIVLVVLYAKEVFVHIKPSLISFSRNETVATFCISRGGVNHKRQSVYDLPR